METKTGLTSPALVLLCGWATWQAYTIRHWCWTRMSRCRRHHLCKHFKRSWKHKQKHLTVKISKEASPEPPKPVAWERWVWFILYELSSFYLLFFYLRASLKPRMSKTWTNNTLISTVWDMSPLMARFQVSESPLLSSSSKTAADPRKRRSAKVNRFLNASNSILSLSLKRVAKGLSRIFPSKVMARG